jgi:hypothetical protein
VTASQYPQVFAGQNLTAGLLQSFAPFTVVKAADTSRTSTTTLASDPDLQFAVAASAVYFWELFIDYEGGTQNSSDITVGWSVPSGTTMRWSRSALTLTGGVDVGVLSDQSGTPSFGTNGAGNTRAIMAKGTLTASTTAGTAAFQWAQHTSNGTATIVHAGSGLLVVRVK